MRKKSFLFGIVLGIATLLCMAAFNPMPFMDSAGNLYLTNANGVTLIFDPGLNNASKLDFWQAGNSMGYIQFNTDGDRMRFVQGGNVPMDIGPGVRIFTNLSVQGSITNQSTVDNAGAIRNFAGVENFGNVTNRGALVFTNGALIDQTAGANLTRFTNSTWEFYGSNNAAGVPALTIRTNGNVGIGTNSPQAKLHVAGDVKIEGAITTANGTLLSNMTDTWTNAGTTYNAIRMNVIETASAADSRLLTLEVNTNGMYQFMRDKKFFIFNTNTDATTYERGGVWWSNNVFRVGTEKGSVGGTARDVYIMTPARQWVFTDANGSFSAPGNITISASGGLQILGRSEFYSQGNGTWSMFASGLGDFVGLNWGNNTATYPQLKRVGAGLALIGAGAVASSSNNLAIAGMLAVTNGIASWISNGIPSLGITFPATTANWTNTLAYNVVLYIDNTGVTATAIAKNGQQIFGVPPVATTLMLKPNDYFSETYSAGTPTARWEPQ